MLFLGEYYNQFMMSDVLVAALSVGVPTVAFVLFALLVVVLLHVGRPVRGKAIAGGLAVLAVVVVAPAFPVASFIAERGLDDEPLIWTGLLWVAYLGPMALTVLLGLDLIGRWWSHEETVEAPDTAAVTEPVPAATPAPATYSSPQPPTAGQ